MICGFRGYGGLGAGALASCQRHQLFESILNNVVSLSFRVNSHRQKCAKASFYYCVWSVLAVRRWTEGEVTALTGRLSFVKTLREGAAMHLTQACRHGRIHTHAHTDCLVCC